MLKAKAIVFPRGRDHQTVIEYQAVNPENIHMNNVIWTEQVTLMYLGM